MPPPSNSNAKTQQETSHVVRNGRRLATDARRGQAPVPFMHDDPANEDARENKRPTPPTLGP